MTSPELLPDEPLAKKLITKGFWLYFFSFIIAPLSYLIKIIISSDLAVEEVGILYSVIGLIWLFASYNDLGMTESLNHFIPKFIVEKRIDKVKSIAIYAFLTQVITGIVIASLFYFWSNWLAVNYFKSTNAIQVLKVFSLYFLGYNFFQILWTFFIAIQKVFFRKVVDFSKIAWIALFTVLLFFFDKWSLLHYSISWISGLYISISLAILIFLKYFYKNFFQGVNTIRSKSLFQKVGKYALMVFIGSSAGTILGQIDLQMVLYFLWVESAGYYTNYLSIVKISWIIIWPISMLLFPLVSEAYSKKSVSKILLLKEILMNNFIIIAIIFSIFSFIFAEPIALILFWNKFALSGAILQYSVLFVVFNMLMIINFNILAGIWKAKEKTKIILIAIIFNTISNYVLIQFLWIYGAALATGFWWLIMWILGEKFLGKKYRSNIDWQQIKINLIFFIILWIWSLYIPLYSIESNRWANVPILIIVFLLYIWCFVLINLKKFKILIREVKKIRS